MLAGPIERDFSISLALTAEQTTKEKFPKPSSPSFAFGPTVQKKVGADQGV